MQSHEGAAMEGDKLEVLVAGNTRYVTRKWLEQTFPSGHVVVLGDRRIGSDKRISVVSLSREQEVKALDKLFETYAFDRVVWFSPQLTPGQGSFAAMSFFQKLLNCCNPRTQVLCLEGRAVQPEGKLDAYSELSERLCKDAEPQVQRVLLPWLYDASAEGDFLSGAFADLSDLKRAEFSREPAFAIFLLDLMAFVQYDENPKNVILGLTR